MKFVLICSIVIYLVSVCGSAAADAAGTTRQTQQHQTTNTQQGESRASITDVWRPPFGDIKIDPNEWTAAFSERMMKVGVAVVAVALNKATMTQTFLMGLFVFGIVNLTWLITATSVIAFLGWRKKQMVMLGGGLLVTYYLLFQAPPAAGS